MRLSLGVVGNIAEAMKAEIKAGQEAVKIAMSEVAQDGKKDWRQQIVSAGLGKRLANAVRGDVYPKDKYSFSAAAVIWTKAAKITDAHERGVTVKSSRGFFLAIPTDAAPKAGRFGKMTPAEYERRTGSQLTFVYRKNRPSLLVDQGARVNRKTGRVMKARAAPGQGSVTIPVFVLIPQARLRKRLNLMASADTWQARVPAAIARNWGRIAAARRERAAQLRDGAQ